jgi:Cellulase (glycosyl hydrolase family 5)
MSLLSRSSLFLILLLVTSPSASHAQLTAKDTDAAGRWSKAQANEWYAQQPWPVGCNFLPSTAINQLEMWQAETFDPITIDRELGFAEKLGFNSVRVFLHDLLWIQDKEGFLRRIDDFLTIADKHKIKTMFVLYDSCWHPLPKLGKQPEPRPHTHNSGWVQNPGVLVLKNPAAFPHLKEYTMGVVGRFAKDPRVVAWDIWNEPDNFDGGAPGRPNLEPKNKPDLVNALLPDVFAWAREVKPVQPLTSGVWNLTQSMAFLSPCKQIQLSNSDVISYHCYGDADEMRECIDRLSKFGRPLLCTEYMARPVKSTFEPQLQIMKSAKIAAYCWGFVNGKSQTIYPWDSWTTPYTSEPPVWFHDILKQDGSPYIAEEVEYIKSLTKP